MAKISGLNLSDSKYERENTYELLPAGWYEAKIDRAEIKETSTGGERISVGYKIQGGKYNDRFVWGSFNTRNNSEQAEKIGRQQLRTCLNAIGIKPEDFDDTDQLVGQDLMIKVKVKPAQGNYDASNDAADFKSLDGSAAGASDGGEKKTPWAK